VFAHGTRTEPVPADLSTDQLAAQPTPDQPERRAVPTGFEPVSPP